MFCLISSSLIPPHCISSLQITSYFPLFSAHVIKPLSPRDLIISFHRSLLSHKCKSVVPIQTSPFNSFNQISFQIIPFALFLIFCLISFHFISFHLIRSPVVRVCAEEPDVRTRKIVKVVTQTMINGKVVDESSEVEQIEETKK